MTTRAHCNHDPVVATAAMLVASVVWAPVAHAYLDPGTGSMVVQMVIGAVVAVGAMVSLYWHRLKRFLTRLSRSRDASGSGASHKNGLGKDAPSE